MMKLLCMIIILANIFLFFWEYRSGAFESGKPQPDNALSEGKEKILLVSELNAQKPPPSDSTLPANQNQAGKDQARQADEAKNTNRQDSGQDSSGSGPWP